MPGWNESSWFLFLEGVALKSVAVLGVAWLAALCVRRRSAATRHIVWMAAFAALLALPLLSIIMPALPIPGTAATVAPQVVFQADAGAADLGSPGLLADASVGEEAERPSSAPIGGFPRLNWRAAAMLVWALGAAALLLQMLAGLAHMQRLRLRARALSGGDLPELASALGIPNRVHAFETEPGRMPMSFGLLRPAVFMPADSAGWSEERRRIVLLHELAHVRRGDHAMHLVARAALCLYWWNPLAWLAWRAFLKERERAADDLVLAAGAHASDYAGHLLEIARAMRSAPVLGAAAVAVARRSQLEGRLLAILDSARNRTAPGRTGALAAALICAAVVIPIAALRAQDNSQEYRAGFTALSAKQYDEAADHFQRAQLTDPANAAVAAMWQAIVRERQGRLSDADSLYKMALNLSTPDSPEQATVMELYARLLQIESRPDEAADMRAKAAKLRTTIQPAAPAFERGKTQPQSVSAGLGSSVSRVGGTAIALPPVPPPRLTIASVPRIISIVQPAYTDEARAAGLQGSVSVVVGVGPDGAVTSARVQRGLGLGLDEKAIDAVKRWRFAPAQKDGRPVPATATLEVMFRLSPTGAPDQSAAAQAGNGAVPPWPPSQALVTRATQATDDAASSGAGVFRVGGGVTAPTLLQKVEPEYAEAARAAGYQGTVVLYIEVGPDGKANNIRVQRSLGMGLDEKAIEAVRKWTFAPGKKDGQPVTVAATIEVNFRLPLPPTGSEAMVGSGSVYRVGSGVTPPRLLQKVEPEYTEEARAAKYQGTVILEVEVGTDGLPQKIVVKRGLGLGLDQKAVDAVSRWRFEPGTRFGVPVTVAATIEVNFRLL